MRILIGSRNTRNRHDTMLLFCTSVLVILAYAFGVSADNPRVQTPLGVVEGTVDKSVNGKEFLSFLGVPYAKPPVGENRFKEAIPIEPWEGIWKANTVYECMQYSFFPRSDLDPVEGTEDCLYVNIFTPKLNGNLDVIVYIHGGGFIYGSGASYRPHILLDYDVVYVSLNYRLGPLGFLSTEDDTVPGNNGLKDQTLALKWIKENIKHFGGNPNSITISGMSAGGVSVHYHMISPKSKGLFHRAISMSGCILNPWAMMEEPLQITKQLSSAVGCDHHGIKEMVTCLKKRPAKQIVSFVKNIQRWLYNPFSPFGFVVDGSWASDPVFKKHPLQILKEKPVSDIPWILSHVTGEGLYNAYDFYPQDRIEYIDENWNEVMPHILHYNFTIPISEHNSVSQKIRSEYFGDQHLRKQNFNKLVELMGDRLFKLDLDKCSRLQAASMTSPIWYYVFDYGGAHSESEIKSGANAHIGVSHADDTLYVLDCGTDMLSTKEDRAMSKFMINMFLSFASSGKPDVNTTWIPIAKTSNSPLRYLKINSPTWIVNEQAGEFGNRHFWDSIPFKENERLFEAKDEL